MLRRRTFVWLIAVAIGMAYAPIGVAQTIEKAAASGAVTGKVIAVNAAEATIQIQGANDDGGVYAVDPAASILNGATKIGLADIRAGWTVTVTFDESLAGKKVAKMISVDDAPN